MAGRTWYWTQVVKATNDSDFKAVEISVSLKESRADNITTVVAYLAKPSEITQ